MTPTHIGKGTTFSATPRKSENPPPPLRAKFELPIPPLNIDVGGWNYKPYNMQPNYNIHYFLEMLLLHCTIDIACKWYLGSLS